MHKNMHLLKEFWIWVKLEGSRTNAKERAINELEFAAVQEKMLYQPSGCNQAAPIYNILKLKS